jgi:hypothetical protein
MCGIVGALAFGKFEKKQDEIARREAIIFITTQLLQVTVDRGKDATGTSVLFSDGNFAGLKMGIPSPEFIARYGETEKDYEGLLKLMREYKAPIRTFLGHCRKATVGNTYDNKNNQPVQVGDIVLIHNGTIDNHHIICNNLGCDRTGDVDSEAIAQLLYHYSQNGTIPFTMKMLEETTKRLDGSYSVLGFNGNNPYQVFQFRDGRPAEMCLIRPLKTVFIASEKKFIENTLFEYNKMAKLFSPNIKLPYLRKENVEFDFMADDTFGLWDLTKDIDDNTLIRSLYETDKSVLLANKLWKVPTKGTTTVYGNTAAHNYNTSAMGGLPGAGWAGASSDRCASSAKDSTANVSASKDDDDTDSAYIWNEKLDAYVKETSIGASADLNVQINAESGKMEDVSKLVDEVIADAALNQSGNDKNGGLTEVPPNQSENLVSDPAKVNEVAPPPAKPIEKSTIVEVDLKIDPEALKKAKEYVERGLIKFETNTEVMDVLEVKHEDSLKNLPLFALTNRIIKYFAAKFFYAGYKARKEEENTGDDKQKSAEKKIRVLKITAKILGKALDTFKPKEVDKSIDEQIKDMPKIVNTLQIEDITSVLTGGDTKTSPTLKSLAGKLKEATDKKE